MGRLKRERLDGLAEFGARLRELREAAGLSQMKVSELMGFNPTHGYKYILKLEKGSVPNPTLRTIISFLEVCGRDWTDVADALPHAGRRKAEPGKPPARPVEVPAPPARAQAGGPARRDPRPLRVRLRAERIAGRERRAAELWQAVTRTEAAVTRLFRSGSFVKPGTRTAKLERSYAGFIRPCCATLQAYARARPRMVENEVSKLVEPAVESGLDRTLLEEIVRLCREHLSGDG
ncbi:MAG TPA: XRE family transcriptional regulator [candidate division WOR-3 bacterium]|uniref:XRE family transcriptional regulator n=1 Tax=candidate division WOR-3 bacterium TaxID=2052148 RepID=A0A7V0XEH3_UNCW3|nr:XRE family transcriptional regulator [candidate division WOR-3 bacterium]